MDVVDSQMHIGPGRIEERLAAMDAVGIKAALIDELWMEDHWLKDHAPVRPGYTIAGVRRNSTPTAELAAINYPDRFSYLVKVDRLDPEISAILRFVRDAPHARAIRFECYGATEISALASGDYDTIFAQATDYGLPMFLVIPGYADLLKRCADKFPDGKFIIDHCGMPFTDEINQGMVLTGLATEADVEFMNRARRQSRAADFEKVLKIADNANVALKWAHAPALFGVSGYPFLGLRPYLRSALDAYGADRVMWSADIKANRTGESWAELMFWIKDNPELSDEEKAGVLGGAVRKWIKWQA